MLMLKGLVLTAVHFVRKVSAMWNSVTRDVTVDAFTVLTLEALALFFGPTRAVGRQLISVETRTIERACRVRADLLARVDQKLTFVHI